MGALSASATRSSLAGLLLLLCTCALLTPTVAAYKLGDPVPMLKRAQYKGLRTEWSEVIAAEAPKFGITKTVRLNPLSDAKEYDTSSEFKLSFSFSGERLLVPWITVTDGKAHFIQQIDFYFVHAQGFILSVKWRATYYPDVTSKPEYSHLVYHWEERLETDPAVGVNILLLVGVVVSWLAGVLILLEWDRHPRESPKEGEAAALLAASRNAASRAVHTSSWEDRHDS